MNKAFIREAEPSANGHCPRCGSLGLPVGAVTLAAHVAEPACAAIAAEAFFCPFPTCPVAYFDQFERTIAIDALKGPVYPKHPDAPICPCLGITVDQVEADAMAGRVDRVRRVIATARCGQADCLTHSPSGQSCVAAVQGCYMRTLARGASP